MMCQKSFYALAAAHPFTCVGFANKENKKIANARSVETAIGIIVETACVRIIAG